MLKMKISHFFLQNLSKSSTKLTFLVIFLNLFALLKENYFMFEL